MSEPNSAQIAELIESVSNNAQLVELIESVSRGPGTICRVTVRNGCPPAWGVVLIAGAVKFFYEDGTEFVDGPHAFNVPSGGEISFSNNDPQKCVKAESTFITARIPNQGDQIVQGDATTDKPDQCLISVPQTIGPKRSISKDELSRGLSSVLEIIEERR